MTMTEDFLPAEGDQEFDTGPTYPSVFGMQLTPPVQSLAIVLLGVAGAFAIYNFLVSPVRQEINTVQGQVNDLQSQVDQQRASLQGLAELQAQLDTAIQQRVAIYSLLGSRSSLETLMIDINQQIQNSNAAIEDVLRSDVNQIDQGQLAALGLNQAQIQQVRSAFAEDLALQRQIYTSELLQFTPSQPVPLGEGGPPELANNLNRQTVDISMRALFPQTLSILRNLERLEPLIVVRGLNQSIASPPAGASEDQLVGVSRQLDTTFTLEVLVPAIDPGTPPEPPAAEEEEEGS